MLRALDVSKNALPYCQPNPPVGCVLVANGDIVAEGFTQPIGGHHAEVEALGKLSSNIDIKTVTAYVTLEPCSFIGRTPACAETLLNSGIGKVVVSLLDPDRRNNGAGIAMLQQGGVHVEVGLARDEVETFLTPYLGLSW
ncbi:DeoR faimly transcriptional regulator [Grimontia sp. AD028]|nr:bifunctional diaminohydroxyphosphoribosylaminopyrimidine deaminase/5-amino-6-(5-phosphoribosylamino)uracil reductase RibD [Grimontia kaedaensis]EOD80841.1 Diaminohydroxyphosphoribosylaminopyrimidine deaminase [Grimontia indica]KKD58321.1 DeoR faimly transcriptional regulator [Grimontia sp. AD028]USH05626.1 bifunctional diaminohydroxyphosphoribosylaminopyrimidine deaminase/5-amino-6-(5-phosphoribosylamino)uracil reductase RibD [Grimontia kaedaensis]